MEHESRLGKIGSRFERPGFPRGAADFLTVGGRAVMPAWNTVMQLPASGLVGREYGSLTVLADGLHATLEQGELSKMRLFAGLGVDLKPVHHLAFWHGRGTTLERDALVSVVQQCPGMLFDLACGCGHARDEAVRQIYNHDATAGVLISFNHLTPSGTKGEIARSILDSVGVSEVRHVTPYSVRDPLKEECELRLALLQESSDVRVFTSGANVYLRTHDMPVFFADGTPARLLVFKEPHKKERNGFNQMDKIYHVLVVGDIQKKTPYIRYHSECTTADHGSNACDCNEQRIATLRLMREHGAGVLIHAPEDGMGLGSLSKFAQTFLTLRGETDLLRAREDHLDLPGDARSYEFNDIVRQALGVERAILASNNRQKRARFERWGIEIVGNMPLKIDLTRLHHRAAADVEAKKASGRYDKNLVA